MNWCSVHVQDSTDIHTSHRMAASKRSIWPRKYAKTSLIKTKSNSKIWSSPPIYRFSNGKQPYCALLMANTSLSNVWVTWSKWLLLNTTNVATNPMGKTYQKSLGKWFVARSTTRKIRPLTKSVKRSQTKLDLLSVSCSTKTLSCVQSSIKRSMMLKVSRDFK